MQFSFRTLISMTNWIQFGISFCLTLTLILVESTCFHFQSALRKLILRKGFLEMGGLNASCVLSPSDSNFFTSLEPNSFWGQKDCKNEREGRFYWSPSRNLMWNFVSCAPTESLENSARGALYECGRSWEELRLHEYSLLSDLCQKMLIPIQQCNIS